MATIDEIQVIEFTFTDFPDTVSGFWRQSVVQIYGILQIERCLFKQRQKL